MIYGLITLSCLNVFLLVYVWRLRKSRKTAKPQLTQDASQLMASLLNGGAVSVVKIIDPDSIFLHSPRGN
jgi:hypothetical protein